MGAWLPWWLLVVPPILLLVDSMMAPKSSSMSNTPARTDTPAAPRRAG